MGVERMAAKGPAPAVPTFTSHEPPVAALFASPARRAAVPPEVDEVLRTAGEPLDEEVRARAEARFGHDFSRVRVHAEPRASASARAVNALAYTVGPHIVFDEGRYAPGSWEGRR